MMIYLFIKSFLPLFIAITVGSLLIFLIGLYYIYISCFHSTKASDESAHNKDIAAIAGDNLIATQLDLARAYIELNQKNKAKKILNNVAKQGSHAQQKEARMLLGLI